MTEFHARRSGDGPHGNAQTAPRWDDHFAPERAGAKPAHPLSRATYALGSILSVGLVIGLGVTGYKLLVRDVSGVPVIRAVEGPTRIQPEDPGGQQTLNQGLAVNAVAAVGSASAPPDELILAPAPLSLSAEDVPHVAASASEDEGVIAAEDTLSEAAPEIGTAVAAPAPEAITREHIQQEEGGEVVGAFGRGEPEELEVVSDEIDTDTAESPEMLALAKAIGAAITPLEALPDNMAAETADDITPALRPRARPAALSNIRQTAVSESSSASTSTSTTKDVSPDSIAVGTRLAQLGAFSSEEIAREEWERLSARFADYLANKDRVIQRATSGGRTFYRLRALGFEDLADARRFCSALVAEKAECIPVVMR